MSARELGRTDITGVGFDASDGVEVVAEDICSGECLVPVVAVVNFAARQHFPDSDKHQYSMTDPQTFRWCYGGCGSVSDKPLARRGALAQGPNMSL